MSVCAARMLVTLQPAPAFHRAGYILTTTFPHEPVEQNGLVLSLLIDYPAVPRNFRLCKHCGSVYSEDLE